METLLPLGADTYITNDNCGRRSDRELDFARRLSVAPLGDRSVGYEFVIGFAKSGINVTAYAEVMFTQVGRVGISFTSSNVGASPSGDLTTEFQAAVDRAETLRGLSSSTPVTRISQ